MENEVRLIDANAFCERYSHFGLVNGSTIGRHSGMAEFLLDELQKAPTIDPESLRPKGRWELHGNDDDCGCSYFCSNCHRSYPEEWFYDHGRYVPFENCPHCTAKMER